MFNTNAQCYQNISQVLLTSAFILWPTCTLRYSGKNPIRYAVFWRISVRFCGFRTPPPPLTPPPNYSQIPFKKYKVIASIAPNRLYPGYQSFFLACDEELRRAQAEDTDGEAARKTSGAESPDLQCYMGFDLVSNLSIKPAVARLIS